MRRFGDFSIHPSSKILHPSYLSTQGRLSVDRGVFIDPLCTSGVNFQGPVSIGMYTTILCTSVYASPGKGLTVGANVGLGTHSFYGCAGGITIGNNVLVGNYVSFHSENHIFDNRERVIADQGVTRKGIVVGNDCWIGAKSTILDGAIIGDGCVVAAGSVVRGEIPPFSVIGGIPAKVIKQRGPFDKTV